MLVAAAQNNNWQLVGHGGSICLEPILKGSGDLRSSEVAAGKQLPGFGMEIRNSKHDSCYVAKRYFAE